jgi:hypothetical protein
MPWTLLHLIALPSCARKTTEQAGKFRIGAVGNYAEILTLCIVAVESSDLVVGLREIAYG